MIFTHEQLLDFFCKNMVYLFCTTASKVFQRFCCSYKMAKSPDSKLKKSVEPAQMFADLVHDLTEWHQHFHLSHFFHSCWWKHQPSLHVKTTANDIPPCSVGDNGDGTLLGMKRSAELQGQTHPPASSCNPTELLQDQDGIEIQ